MRESQKEKLTVKRSTREKENKMKRGNNDRRVVLCSTVEPAAG